MSQHDFDIANQTAPNTRADINNALKALASVSSGSSAPTTTYANMIYYNTTDNKLWKRNEADSGWISLGVVSEVQNVFYPSGVSFATQAEALAGTVDDRHMSPLKVRQALNAANAAPIYACRAWARFNGTTGAILASGNVASITRVSVGYYTVTLSTAMPNANYAVVASAAGVVNHPVCAAALDGTPSTSTFNLSVGITGGQGSLGDRRDSEMVSFSIFG